MANGVKYSTGSTPAGCLRKGNMLLAVGQQDYGTSFYSGVNPPAGGYTIYVNKATSGPSIHCAQTDSELIRITNQISGANYTTASQCFSYLASQSDKIIVDFAHPDIPTSDLLLHLDANFTASYPNTGTTWYDISGNSNDALLANGPAWNSNGWFTLDGADDRIRKASNILTTRRGTVVMWVRTTDTTFLLVEGQTTGHYLGAIYVGSNWYDAACGQPSYYVDLNQSLNPNDEGYIDGRFHMIEVRDVDFSTWTTHQFLDYAGGGTFNMQGDVAKIQMYNRPLTDGESFQNYYGGAITTDGLALSVDGANIVSYAGTGSTWYDMSRNGYSVTNCNMQKSKNNYYSLWSNGNDADVTVSPILNNDYHSVELLLMFKGSAAYPNGYTGGWEQFFGYFAGGTTDRSPGVWRFPSARLIHWQYAPGYNGPNFGKNSANDEFDLNTYYHIVVTKEGGTVKTYINGVLTNTVGASNPKTAGDSNIRFFDYYSADLMEIQVCRIYERTISQDEVSLNYSAVKNRM